MQWGDLRLSTPPCVPCAPCVERRVYFSRRVSAVCAVCPPCVAVCAVCAVCILGRPVNSWTKLSNRYLMVINIFSVNQFKYEQMEKTIFNFLT